MLELKSELDAVEEICMSGLKQNIEMIWLLLAKREFYCCRSFLFLKGLFEPRFPIFHKCQFYTRAEEGTTSG